MLHYLRWDEIANLLHTTSEKSRDYLIKDYQLLLDPILTESRIILHRPLSLIKKGSTNIREENLAFKFLGEIYFMLHTTNCILIGGK